MLFCLLLLKTNQCFLENDYFTLFFCSPKGEQVVATLSVRPYIRPYASSYARP